MASGSTRQRVVCLKRLGSWKLAKNRCITEKQNTQAKEESKGGRGVGRKLREAFCDTKVKFPSAVLL
jgi:hypothetical protein